MSKKLSLLAAACLAASGCSSFNGRVAGKELAVQDALFFNYLFNGQTVGATIILVDKPRVCDSLKANRVPKNANFAALTLFRVTSSGSVVPPDTGDYTVTTNVAPTVGNFAYGQFNALDANCNQTLPDTANQGTSGLVKVNSYKPSEGGGMTGTFDITWGAQNDKSTGTFNATYCNLTTNFPSNANCE
jgi:hypothetical protein